MNAKLKQIVMTGKVMTNLKTKARLHIVSPRVSKHSYTSLNDFYLLMPLSSPSALF